METTSKKNWQTHNNEFYLRDISSNVEILEAAVYNLQSTPLGELYLKKMSNEFEFDFKIYGLESNFVHKVINTWDSTKGNMGVLCNGVKGTGKTITSEIIANKTGLPVILIGANFGGLNDFLSDIHQNVVVFIDEYEKIFSGKVSTEDFDYDENGSGTGGDSTLLGIMDGTYKTKWRKMFILTTNRTWLNENMMNRPGRIRYIKNFNDLPLDQINEIIGDCLLEKKQKDSVMDYVKRLKIITVDILKTIISEVNIYKAPPEECCKELNIEFKEEEYTVIRLAAGKKKQETLAIGINSQRIAHVLNPKKNWNGMYIEVDGDILYLSAKPDYKNNVYTVWDQSIGRDKPFKIKLKKEAGIHRSFYAF